jgi:hypothetical protein
VNRPRGLLLKNYKRKGELWNMDKLLENRMLRRRTKWGDGQVGVAAGFMALSPNRQNLPTSGTCRQAKQL